MTNDPVDRLVRPRAVDSSGAGGRLPTGAGPYPCVARLDAEAAAARLRERFG